MGLRAPNHTQTPNELFDDWLPKLKFAEMKVLMVVIRKTFGWHKIRDRISLSQLETLTGMQRRSIIDAAKSLMKKNLITKEVVGRSGTQDTYYELVVDDDSNHAYQCSKYTPPSVVATPTKETLTKERREKSKPKENEDSATAAPLADFLLSKIKEKKPNFTKKTTDGWEKDCVKLLKIRSLEELKKLIDFCVNHEFWHKNVLSPAKLLKHLDALEIEINKSTREDAKNKSFVPKTTSTSPPANEDHVQNNRDLVKLVRKKHWDAFKNYKISDSSIDYLQFNHSDKISSKIYLKNKEFREQVLENLSKMRLPVEGL